LSDKKETNGHGEKYEPAVEYDYLDADVWIKKKGDKKDVAYTSEIEAEIQDSDENLDNSDN
jgi:hypothetical protein